MSSISSLSGMSSTTITQGAHHRQRPNPTEMAENLFSKLDAAGQGFISKTDLQSALDSVKSGSASSSADELFSKLDTDSDGKVTKQEFSDVLTSMAQQMDQQFANMRMSGAMGGMGGGQGGGMPPPPPPGGKDNGFTKDELSTQLNEIGSTDSNLSSLISNIVQNFDAADTNGDGKVSFKEAMTFDQASRSSSSATSSTSTSSTNATDTASTTADTSSTKLMQQIMRLMQAYNVGENRGGSSTSLLSVSA